MTDLFTFIGVLFAASCILGYIFASIITMIHVWDEQDKELKKLRKEGDALNTLKQSTRRK